jgi:hypothetical protein
MEELTFNNLSNSYNNNLTKKVEVGIGKMLGYYRKNSFKKLHR